MNILAISAQPDLPESHLLVALKRAGLEIDLLCDESGPNTAMLREAGIPVTHFVCPSRLHLSSIKLIRRMLKARRYDIVHAFSSRGLSNAFLASCCIPVKFVAYRGTVGHLSRFDPATWLTYLNPWVSKIVCVSNAVRDYLLRLGIPASRLVTIYKGHVLAWYENLKRIDLQTLGVPSGAFVVGCAANMRPVKGVDILLEGMGLLSNSSPVHLLLVGEIRDERIKRLIEMPGVKERVHVTGFRRDAAALMGSCHAFVMPSRKREGLPRAVIEAMAQAVPPIVTNVGGMPELVVNEVHGLVVPPSDARALTSAMERLASDAALREKLSKNAQARIRDEFSHARTVEQTLSMYRELV